MTSLNCNQCGQEYPSSEVIGKIVSTEKYLKIEHKCPICNWLNHTLFGTERVIKEI